MNEEEEQYQTNSTTISFLNKRSRPILKFLKLGRLRKKKVKIQEITTIYFIC